MKIRSGTIASILITTFFLTLIILAGCSQKDSRGSVYPPLGNLDIIPVDTMDRVFPDIAPKPMLYTDPISVPRGGKVAFQYAVTSVVGLTYTMSVSPAKRSDDTVLSGAYTLYEILPVYVEGDSNGAGTSPHPAETTAAYKAGLYRDGPFWVCEALSKASQIDLVANTYHGVLMDCQVTADTLPGTYSGYITFENASNTIKVPYSLKVEDTVFAGYDLDTTHWFFYKPELLTTATPPETWSQEHWDLIEYSAHTLAEYGQNQIFTPTLYRTFVDVHITAEGKYTFDFSRFNRWAKLFIDDLGFDYLELDTLLSQEGTVSNTYAYDEGLGQRVKIFNSGDAIDDDFRDFLAAYFRALDAELTANGWRDNCRHHITDEALSEYMPQYNDIKAVMNANLPGIEAIDTNWNDPAACSPYMDIQVLSPYCVQNFEDLIASRRAAGKKTWYYDLLQDVPTYPYRWLDKPLATSRLHPWFTYMFKVDGYLRWAGNLYRGADPYTRSAGPGGECGGYPGYPMGENWQFYPSPNGLLGSMRMIAFRDGLTDLTLLKMLAATNQTAADNIMNDIAASDTNYARQPDIYHNARKNILLSLP